MKTPWTEISESAGRMVGALISPLVGLGSRLRRARLFHPEGVCYDAQVAPVLSRRKRPVPAELAAALGELAVRLSGDALIRMSSALWKGGRELPDGLGCAIRFPGSEDGAGDQDLLLATTPHVLVAALAPLWTNPHDFLSNRYYGASPFRVQGVGRLYLRAVPLAAGVGTGNRAARLQQAVAQGTAVLRLEVWPVRKGTGWVPLVEIRLMKPAAVDQEALRFSPYRTGFGLEPEGFIHGLRLWTYAMSQNARDI